MSATEATQQANRAEMDPRRLVVIAYLILGLITAVFLGQILDLIMSKVGVANGKVLDGLDFKVSHIIGFVLAGGIAIYSWVNPRINTLSHECAAELMKVTWPSWSEVRISTMAVVLASIVASLLLFGIDTLAFKLMVDWLPSLWGKLS